PSNSVSNLSIGSFTLTTTLWRLSSIFQSVNEEISSVAIEKSTPGQRAAFNSRVERVADLSPLNSEFWTAAQRKQSFATLRLGAASPAADGVCDSGAWSLRRPVDVSGEFESLADILKAACPE